MLNGFVTRLFPAFGKINFDKSADGTISIKSVTDTRADTLSFEKVIF